MLTLPPNPLSADDIDAIKKNLLNNVATPTHVLTKVTPSTVYKSSLSAVIAAPALPSTSFSQDYYFYWVRDGAITMHQIAHLYEYATTPEEKATLKPYLLNYLDFVAKIQSQPALNDINVLGEPKFNIDGTLWVGEWARPQNDGAAFQTITLCNIARILLAEGEEKFVTAHIYNNTDASILKANLEYTAKNWSSPTVGPWEELTGFHFSVRAVQRRALVAGASLAQRLKDPGAAAYYLEQAKYLENAMEGHWDAALGYFFETYKEEDIRGGGITCSLIGGLVNGRLDQAQKDPFSILSERVLSTAFYVRDTFENLYQINVLDRHQNLGGPLIGRYQSDVYDGNRSEYGNPWFMGTAFLVSLYYVAATKLLKGGSLPLSFLVKQFFHQISPTLDFGTASVLDQKSSFFEATVTALVAAGDAMLRAIKAHSMTYTDGSIFHLSEQIDRASGKQVSAPDLSWSYAAVLSALNERMELAKLVR